MNDREKLIALLGRMSCDVIGIDSCDTCEHRYEIDCTAHAYADYLLANGVVVREKGEWKRVDHDGSWRVDKCSICHRRIHYVDYDQPYQFCPNCGADMRGAVNDG